MLPNRVQPELIFMAGAFEQQLSRNLPRLKLTVDTATAACLVERSEWQRRTRTRRSREPARAALTAKFERRCSGFTNGVMPACSSGTTVTSGCRTLRAPRDTLSLGGRGLRSLRWSGSRLTASSALKRGARAARRGVISSRGPKGPHRRSSGRCQARVNGVFRSSVYSGSGVWGVSSEGRLNPFSRR